MRRWIIGGCALLFVVGGAPGARAQDPNAPRAPLAMPLLVGTPASGALSQRPVPALAAEQMNRLQQATQMRDAGLVDRAREALAALLDDVPHHPLILSELARTLLAKQDFAAVERLGRTERAALKDSVLLGRELAAALERLGRPRESAQVAIEMWSASPAQAEWAGSVIGRLTTADTRAIREAMRHAAERLPTRVDLTRGLASVELRLGDTRAALKTLAVADRQGLGPGVRWGFAEELVRRGTMRDSTAAIDVLMDLAGDPGREATYRLTSARRAWDLARARDGEAEIAPRVAQALTDVSPTRWPPAFLADVSRGLRRAGMTDASRALLKARGDVALPPELALEQALNELRDGPPERALPALEAHAGRSPEAAFRYAEGLFFAGQPDSALEWYKRISSKPEDPFAGAALERIFLIEEAGGRETPVFGRLAYEEWRGDSRRATALADSLYRTLPRSPAWAHAAMILSARLEAAGDARAALGPLIALADSLPGDRLAPVARQRAGDLYLLRLKDEAHALEQYEECLARYPRAWNAPEVRRRVEALRRERRF